MNEPDVSPSLPCLHSVLYRSAIAEKTLSILFFLQKNRIFEFLKRRAPFRLFETRAEGLCFSKKQN